jgi:hypothetical protein
MKILQEQSITAINRPQVAKLSLKEIQKDKSFSKIHKAIMVDLEIEEQMNNTLMTNLILLMES